MMLPPAVRRDFNSLFNSLLTSRTDSTVKKFLKKSFYCGVELGKFRYSCHSLLLLSPFIFLV